MRLHAAIAAFAVVNLNLHAADVRVRVTSPAPAGLSEQVTGEIAAAVADVKTLNVNGPRGRCAVQLMPVAGGVSALVWQSQGAGAYSIESRPRVSQETNAPIAQVAGSGVLIDNGVLSTSHSATNAGGFPSEVMIAGAKLPLRFDCADRLYHKEIGQLWLARNPKPGIRLIANGPLCATVEVSGGYFREEQGQSVQHESRPNARYRFTYYRNSPLVRVDAVVTQQSSFAWNELHVLELRVPETSAASSGREKVIAVAGEMPLSTSGKSWAGGAPMAEGMVNHANDSKRFSRWAAIYFDNGVAGVMNTRTATDHGHQARIYDGPGLLYVMGPWVAFSGPRAEFSRWLFFGPRNTPRQTLDAVSRQLADGQPPAVEWPELERRGRELRSDLRSALPGLGNRTMRALRMWQISNALADLRSLRNVAAARAVLTTPAPKRTLPRETPPDVEMLALADGRDALVTDQLLLAFDTRGRLAEFYQALTDTSLLVKPCSMFRFVARNPLGVESTLTANEAERVTADFNSTNGVLRLRYTGQVFGAHPAVVDVVLRPNGPSVHWSAAAACQGQGVTCWRLDFPVLDGLGRPEGDDGGDVIIVPDGWGRRLPRPTTVNYTGRYPGGSTTMQFVAATRGEATTLGVIARDGRCFVKDMVAKHGDDGRTFEMSARHYPENMGATATCQWPYEVETVALAGDWFTLAQHYRAWATKQAWCEGGKLRRRRDTPEWFRKLVWWHHDGARDGAKLTDTFDHLRKAVPHPLAFHWYNWHSIPFDNCYPDYFPANDYVLGTRAKLREWGVRVMPYINGHLWDTESKSYGEEGGVRWAMKKPDGSIYTEHWNKHDHSTACPATDAWRKKMVSVTDRLFREIGVDAVCLDQIGAVAAQLCYDASHGHPRGGGDHYVAGYWRLLKAVRENARAITADAALTTVDTAEPFIRYLDGTLMCNKALPDSIPFFPAVYHDYVAQFGLYVYEPEIKERLPFRSKEAMLFQFGGQLGWHGTDWSQATHHREKFFWLNTLAAYRQLGLDWLAYGDMLRPPQVTLHNNKPVPLIPQRWTRYKSEVETEQPAVTASAWQASDGRVAVFVLNVSDKKLNVRVRLPAEAKNKKLAEQAPANAECEKPKVNDNQLCMEMGPQTARMFVAM